MLDEPHLIFIHGLDSSSQSIKARLLQGIFPKMVIPDFDGTLEERMATLNPILEDGMAWRIVGSSFGGLMGALYTCQHPLKVRKLVLLAPALTWPDFANNLPPPVDVPTILYHGKQDEIIPLEAILRLAARVFRNLEQHIVEDNHRLENTVGKLDWQRLLA